MSGKGHTSNVADGRIDRGLWPGARTSHHACGNAGITPSLLFARCNRSNRPVVLCVMKAPSVCFRSNFQLKEINRELTSVDIFSTHPMFHSHDGRDKRLFLLV